MSYQVLARKWRPRTFADMVGQEHVLQALVNALDKNRLHHAYLFTGTRGVGKTTVARIFAKCLNCEKGVSATPCGVCTACTEVDEGRFVDLIEIDAASNTGVDDVRALIENSAYLPTRGRYKVYLIDEVHMLSKPAFNALLKTLEEPPPHVKFLLATTDPEKILVTVLSRCLQFSLKNMLPERIVNHLKYVLEQESIPFEEPALWQLARAAHGSMRDALSLTDQTIAFANGRVSEKEVCTMLGLVDRSHVYTLLNALANNDGAQLLNISADLATRMPDYANVLGDMLSVLHRISVEQHVPGAGGAEDDAEQIRQLARDIEPADVQLFYQIALLGRRDLAFAMDVHAAFEMTLLRMLAFVPQAPEADTGGSHTQKKSPEKHPVNRAPVSSTSSNVVAISRAVEVAPVVEVAVPVPPPLTVVPKMAPAVLFEQLPALSAIGSEHWLTIFKKLNVDGLPRTIAAQCVLHARDDHQLTLHVKKEYAGALTDAHHARLQDALSQLFNEAVVLRIEKVDDVSAETPAAYKMRVDAQRRAQAVADIQNDIRVQMLVRDFNAEVQIDSITPIDLPKE